MAALGPLRPGFVINDKFEVVRVVNRGGMAYVLLVRARGHERMFALKLAHVRDRQANDDHPHNVAIRKEASLLKQLKHQRIVKVFPVGGIPGKAMKDYSARAVNVTGQPWFFVMEFLAGGDLNEYVKQCGPLTVEEAVSIVLNTCMGVMYLHEKHRISHNDIKPENIVFRTPVRAGEPYDVVLIDFGTAAGVQKFKDEAGSWFVMSPERIRGAKGIEPPEQLARIDPRKSDIWSLGIVLYYALSKRLPFDSLRQKRLTTQILNTVPKDIPHIPAELNRFLIEGCLAKRPQYRPTSRECFEFLRQYTRRLAPATSVKEGCYAH